MKKQDIINAYCRIREIDNTIPDEVLDFMKISALEKLDTIERLNLPKDIDGKQLEIGHIVLVRYVWNSYVGEIRSDGLCATGAKRHAFASPHKIQHSSTYQVLSHVNKSHPDHYYMASNWYFSEDGDCPFENRVYNKSKTVKP
jgi:hypothetical protein